MGKLNEYKVDHLILLVGGNPLPNYVAARLLAKSNATLILVHTDKTRPIAVRLHESLQTPAESSQLAGNFAEPELIQVDAHDPHDIYTKVSTRVKDDLKRETRFGLHYTSGNRPMSVHTYDAVEEACRDAQFSYLNASTLEMLVHNADRTTRRFRADELLNMPLRTLFQLQGLKEKPNEPPLDKPIQPKLAAALAELHSMRAGAEAWIKWRRDGSDGWKKLPKNQPRLEKVEAVLGELCGYDPAPDCVANALGYEALPASTVWWKGLWLESHAFAELLKAIKNRTDTLDAMCRVKRIRETSSKDDKDRSKRDFDLDIVVMRRYQLFVLSCIVSNDPQACKDHLMEAYVRARQAGGDEARVGLVCMSESPRQLQAELVSELDAGGKIKVFGQADLVLLAEHISDWLNDQP